MVDSKLITFLKVADKGSYTLAAQELSLTQPAVSQQMKLLENEFGVKLFHRVDNSLKLTYQGDIVKKFARRIVSLYGELGSKLSDEQAGRRSYVIGITHTSEANLIAEVLAHYAEAHPGVKIKILSDSIKKLYEKLSTFEIDLAIVDGASPTKKYSSIPLDTDSLVVVMAKSHPLAKKASVSLADLKKERLILRSKASETRNQFASALAGANCSLDDFNIVLEIDNIMTIKELVAKGEALSVLPRSACHGYGDKQMLSLRPIENLNMIREVSIVFPKDFAERAFVDTLVADYRKMLSR